MKEINERESSSKEGVKRKKKESKLERAGKWLGECMKKQIIYTIWIL